MKKPCNHPGCPHIIATGTYCPAHQSSAPKRHALYDRHVRHTDPALALAARIRSTRAWQKIRRQVLAAHPLCADPYGTHAGVTRSATQVHHISGLIDRPELAFAASNLQPLCSACHARIEREVRA